MKSMGKIVSVILAVMIIFSSMSGVLGIMASAEETNETETVTITESPREHLKEQMRSLYAEAKTIADAEGKKVGGDDELNGVMTVSQTGPWYVYSTNDTSDNWKHTTGYWYRADTSSNLDLRYGHSNWSYTTASVRVSYKDGEAANGEALTALLRPNSSSTDSRYNDFVGLYYEAEVSGEYRISDNSGGFYIRKSAANGYNAYVTVYADGKEVYKSLPLSRANRRAEFDGFTVKLEKGDKIEYRFTYEGVAESYSGDIELDFDPRITLLSKTTSVDLAGDGEVTKVLYDALDLLDASGANTSAKTSQTAVWRAQMYKDSNWTDLTYYCNHSKVYTKYLDWGYNESSHSQTDRISIRYKGSNISNGLIVRTHIPMWRSNMKPARFAYTAEADGTYTLTDKFGEFVVSDGALIQYDYWIQITHNGTVLWKSDILANKGETAKFDGVTLNMSKGDILAIEFKYSKKSTATATYEEGSFDVDFAPILTFTPNAEKTVIEYPAIDAFDALFEDIAFEEGTVETLGTLSQPDFGWVFKYGMSADSLTKMSKFLKKDNVNSQDAIWVSNYLFGSSGSTGDDPGVSRGTGTSSNDYNKLAVHYRSRMESDGSGIRSGKYAYEYAYSFTAPYNGKYVLSQADLRLIKDSTIPGVKLKIYKNGTLFYTSDTVNNENKSVTVPENTFVLSRGEELVIFFERQDSPEDKNFNHWMYLQYTPTITYYDVSVGAEERDAYTPVREERYYAENIAVPKTVAVYVKTNEKNLGGAVVSSENFTLDITSKGYPRVILKDSEIVFPVDIRSDGFNHIAVSYNSEKGEWYLYLNGIKVSTVTGEAVSGENIDKLYVGASADEYNNNYLKGSVAELAVYSEMLTDSEITALTSGVDTDADSLMAYWNLANGDKADGSQNKKTLVSETVLAVAETPESGITFTKQNDRLDSYEVYSTAVNTFETWLKVDSTYREDKEPGCIISSYYGDLSNKVVDYFEINISTNGNPLLEIRSGGVTESFRFNVDVSTGHWLHLAISADYEKGLYNCYINGELADSVAVGTLKIPVSHRAYHISGYYIHNISSIYFDGSLAGMKLYSDLRTADEIRGDLYSTDINDDNLMAYWKMQNKEDGLKDLKGTNDLHFLLNDTADEVIDESFGNYSTFVFIPDPQFINEVKGASAMSKITDWILANKEKENIVGVMGLGDMTDNNTDKEWTAAVTAFEPLKGQVPFVFVGGNHDIEYKNPSPDNPRDVSMFNKYFPYADWEPYMSGFYEEGKIDNMYYLLEDVNGQKYMMLGLEFQPRDAVLEWANKVVSEHSDYKVIVATHGYKFENSQTAESVYITSNSYKNVVGTDTNVGDQIWEKFVSQHENIQAILCGHAATENVCYETKTGVNGNTVIEILVDAQGMERPLDMLGAVMVLRVSEDGTKANINYYSTIKNKFIKDLNQFNVDWIAEPYVAEIDSTKFETFEDAVSQAQDGDTITLLDDVTVADSIVISKNISIDTANYGISNNSANALFEIADGMGMRFDGGVYTFDDDGIIADIDSSGKVDSNDLAYIRQKLLGKYDDTAVYDINGDGAVDIRDLVRIKKLAGNI